VRSRLAAAHVDGISLWTPPAKLCWSCVASQFYGAYVAKSSAGRTLRRPIDAACGARERPPPIGTERSMSRSAPPLHPPKKRAPASSWSSAATKTARTAKAVTGGADR
jgi:hypothetical protein